MRIYPPEEPDRDLIDLKRREEYWDEPYGEEMELPGYRLRQKMRRQKLEELTKREQTNEAT